MSIPSETTLARVTCTVLWLAASCSSSAHSHDPVPPAHPSRSCPPADLVYQVRYAPAPIDRWQLMLGGALDDTAGQLGYGELDAATAHTVRVPPPPAKLWIDDGDSWCVATPAAMYRAPWTDGPLALEYGVELDTACRAPAAKGETLRVAVAGARPPTGCRADTRLQRLTARTVEWHVDANTFDPPSDAPPIDPVVATAIAPMTPSCSPPCLALWTVDAITSRGSAAVWEVNRAWVTPDATNLCNSTQQTSYDVVVARGSAAISLVLHPDGDGFDPDVFAALEDEGGVRVLVTTTIGEYATWEMSTLHVVRRMHYGFPNEEEFAGIHELAPYCGP